MQPLNEGLLLLSFLSNRPIVGSDLRSAARQAGSPPPVHSAEYTSETPSHSDARSSAWHGLDRALATVDLSHSYAETGRDANLKSQLVRQSSPPRNKYPDSSIALHDAHYDEAGLEGDPPLGAARALIAQHFSL